MNDKVKIELILGDCMDQMKKIPDNYVDSIVSDPPAGISFLGKEWDNDKGGRNEWIKWLSEIMIEAMRCLKPGGHCFIWALPRTSHWTATALEDVGFEIRDIVTHVFGSGFPKSLNISKAIDKKMCVEPIIIGEKKGTWLDISGKDLQANGAESRIKLNETIGGCYESRQWEGWGTALKPASEHWILCRKPLSEKTIVDNVLKWGTGGINIDKSRIDYANENDYVVRKESYNNKTCNVMFNTCKTIFGVDNGGRFPANFIHDGSDEVMEEFDKDDNKSRFFYCSKASIKEKNEGLDDFPLKVKEFETQTRTNKETADKFGCERNGLTKNIHPTIKPVKLMSYLINMITPPNGIVLDPFMGSGSTGVAAIKNGYSFIGIEKEREYMDIAKARIYYTKKNI